MTFDNAIKDCERLRKHYATGLAALRKKDRKHVTAKDGRAISGSVHIEAAQRSDAGHNRHTWDYGIGMATAPDDTAVWIELHDANNLHVQLALDKLESLRSFLRSRAPRLDTLPKRFVWLATGRVYIVPDSRERRKLNMAGLLLRSGKLDLESVIR